MITFAPQCTLPESGPGFVKQPNVRSTMDIIWSSLVIIFLCSWSILHLNVPPKFRPLPPPKSKWESMRRTFSTALVFIRRKVIWTLVIIFVPEFSLTVGVTTLMRAKSCTEQIKTFQEEQKLEDEIDWTGTHSMYANMGGFVFKFPQAAMLGPVVESERENGLQEYSSRDATEHRIRLWLEQFRDTNQRGTQNVGPFDWETHSHNFSLAEQYLLENPDDIKEDNTSVSARLLSGDTWTLSGLQILEARRAGIIAMLPNITEDEILDKSKSDAVVTALAILQVLWLIAQLSARTAERREPSQLEISALAFAACALITYGVLFRQPKDINTPTITLARRCPTKDEFRRIAALAPPVASAFRIPSHDTYAFPAIMEQVRVERGSSWVMLLGISVFGSIHLLAWNMHFPTPTEQLLWRVCSILITCIHIVSTALGYLLMAIVAILGAATSMEEETMGLMVALTGYAAATVGLAIYLIARIFLLVESFRATYYLSPSSYIATWASNIPHII